MNYNVIIVIVLIIVVIFMLVMFICVVLGLLFVDRVVVLDVIGF